MNTGMTAEPIWLRVARAARGELNLSRLPQMLSDKALSWLPPNSFARLRTAVYRARGVHIGKGSIILADITLAGGDDIAARLSIGENAVLNGPLHLDLNESITIGDRVHIGHHVVMITSDHTVRGPSRRCGELTPRAIVIEEGAWIGARTTIGPGVTIGRGSVVAMGSVVTASVQPNKVVGGNPARPIKPLGE